MIAAPKKHRKYRVNFKENFTFGSMIIEDAENAKDAQRQASEQKPGVEIKTAHWLY